MTDMNYYYSLVIENKNNIDKFELSKNPSAIPFLEENPKLIDFYGLSFNPNPDAIYLFERYYDEDGKKTVKHNEKESILKNISFNPYAIPLMKKWNIQIHPLNRNIEEWNDTLPLEDLSKNIYAINFFRRNPDKINWDIMAQSNNPLLVELYPLFIQTRIKNKNVTLNFVGYIIQHKTATIDMVDEAIDFFSDDISNKSIKMNIAKICETRHFERFFLKCDFFEEIREENGSDKTTIFITLSKNPNVSKQTIHKTIDFILQNKNEIEWDRLADNAYIGDIYDKYNFVPLINKKDDFWFTLSKNPNAIQILKKNKQNIYWSVLCSNLEGIELLDTYISSFKFPIKEKEKTFIEINTCHKKGCKCPPYFTRKKPLKQILKENKKIIYWSEICKNPNALPLIEKNFKKIRGNYDALHELYKRADSIHLYSRIIPENIDWKELSKNENDSVVLFLYEHADKFTWFTWAELSKNKNPLAVVLLSKYSHKIYFNNFIRTMQKDNLILLSQLIGDKEFKMLIRTEKNYFFSNYSREPDYLEWIDKYFEKEDLDNLFCYFLVTNQTESLWNNNNNKFTLK